MAFDALRMRNIIQLIGILGESSLLWVVSAFLNSTAVFHLGLVVFSGLQILQTHTALVTFIDCDGDTSYVVSVRVWLTNMYWLYSHPCP